MLDRFAMKKNLLLKFWVITRSAIAKLRTGSVAKEAFVNKEHRDILDRVIRESPSSATLDTMRHVLTIIDLGGVLQKDLDAAHELSELMPHDFATRTFVRTMASAFEATLSFMQGLLLNLSAVGKLDLSLEEIVLLRGKTYSVNAAGEIVESDKFLPFTASLLFTLKLYGRKFNVAVFADTKDTNWQHVLKYVKIRNRLMHPRSMSDILISDDEIESLNRAQDWLGKAFQSFVKR